MLKVRSLIVASTGAVVALGYHFPAAAQDPFPFTAATRPVASQNVTPELPPFPEAPQAVTRSPQPNADLPPFPEANATVAANTIKTPKVALAAAPPRPEPTAPPHLIAETFQPAIAESAATNATKTPKPPTFAAVAPSSQERDRTTTPSLAEPPNGELEVNGHSNEAVTLTDAEPLKPTDAKTIPSSLIVQATPEDEDTEADNTLEPLPEVIVPPATEPVPEIIEELPPPQAESTTTPDNEASEAVEVLVENETPATSDAPTREVVDNETPATSDAPVDEELVITNEPVPGSEPADLPTVNTDVDGLTVQTPPRTQLVPPPDFLNPSGNPLLFPTEADEVTIDISQPITLEEAIALARRNNQTLQSARLDLERAYETLKNARAGLFPTVDGTVTLSRSNSASTEISQQRQGALSGALGTDATTDSLDAQVQVTYNILNGGQVAAEIRQAKDLIRFNELEVEELTEEIHLSVTQAYYALQEADQRVRIEVAAIEQAEQTLRDAELLLEAGLGTRFDVIRAQVDLANSNQDYTQAAATQNIARRELAEVLAVGQQVEVTIADVIEPVEPWQLALEETIVLAYRNRAELEQRLIEREIEEEDRRIARSALRPSVDLFASYNVLDILDDDFDGSSGYTIGAQLQWRFFDGGAARAQKRQAEIDLELAEVAFEQERNQIRLEVEDAYYNFVANQQNIKTASAAVQLAEESLRLARLRFSAGVGTQTDVIDAQTELTRARGNLLTAIVTYNSSIASLHRAVSNTPDRQLFDLP